MTYFTEDQVQLLLARIHPNRVFQRDGNSYVAGCDIRAELTRIFGFGRWSSEVLDQALLSEKEVKTKKGADAWYVLYRSRIRLTVHAPDGTLVAFHDGSHVGASTHPDFGEAHGNALTNSETYALRRAAINLGDQFGLSLYNKGSLDAIVRWTLVRPEAGDEASTTDTDDVPQVSAEDTGQAEPAEDESAADAFEHGTPAAVPDSAGEAAPAGDQWERPWIDMATEQAASFKTKNAGRELWRETTEKARTHEITSDEDKRIKDLITAQLEYLAKVEKAMALLDPDDLWTERVRDIGDEDEARAVLADLGATANMPIAKGHRIRDAILTAFPAAETEGEAAA